MKVGLWKINRCQRDGHWSTEPRPYFFAIYVTAWGRIFYIKENILKSLLVGVYKKWVGLKNKNYKLGSMRCKKIFFKILLQIFNFTRCPLGIKNQKIIFFAVIAPTPLLLSKMKGVPCPVFSI